MGSYKEIKGDLIKLAHKGEFDLIGHGCNCYATMGAGIAKSIKSNFYGAYLADKNQKEPKGIMRLGNFSFAIEETKGGKKIYVVNFYSQHYPGPDYNYEAIKSSFKALVNNLDEIIEDPSKFKIGLPLIGCGIAGGDWKKVSKIVKKEFKKYNVTVVIFDKDE